MPDTDGLVYQLTRKPNRPTIIFLHGFLGNSNDWQPIITQLADQFGTLTIDLPGHGESLALSNEDYTIESCAERIISLGDQLKLDRLILVGYSMGGRLALYLLTHYADRFEMAVIESANPGLEYESERKDRVKHDRKLAQELERSDLERWLKRWYAQPLFASLADQTDLLKKTISSRSKNQPSGLVKSLKLSSVGRQPNLWPQLAEIKTPLLLITGAKDEKYSRIIGRIADLCLNGVPVIIENAGHNVHLEQPARYLTELKRFLTNYSASD